MSSGSRSFRSGSYCDFSDAVVELCLPGVGVSGLVEVVGLVGEGIHVLTEEVAPLELENMGTKITALDFYVAKPAKVICRPAAEVAQRTEARIEVGSYLKKLRVPFYMKFYYFSPYKSLQHFSTLLKC